jgi:anthranilate synthase component 1
MALVRTDYETFEHQAAVARAEGRVAVPVIREQVADHTTPVAAYQAIAGRGVPSALLESVPQGEHVGRYSIIAAHPFLRFQAWGDESTTSFAVSGEHRCVRHRQGTLLQLERLLERYSPLLTPGLPPFVGGAIGYISYEAVASLLEPTVPRAATDDLELPDIDLVFFDEVVVFDHASQGAYLVVNAFPGGERESRQRSYERARRRLDALGEALNRSLQPLGRLTGNGRPVTANVTREQYGKMVEAAKRHIAAGDVFQVVLAQRFETVFTGSSLDLYRHLRRRNPSPYLFHVDFGDGVRLVGASPEVMVRVRDGGLSLRPIAGTRRRGVDAVDDERLAAELLADPKEQAEHRMLVDLGRNDVGRFCTAGSVRVERPMHVERYSHVMHLVTDVRGWLNSNVTALRACFGCLPAGTVSGAPKISAMQVIAALEPTCRGPYGGAVGYFTRDAVDTCIGIRFALLKGKQLYWQSGGGIVADSDAEREFDETMAKAAAIRGLLESEEG